MMLKYLSDHFSSSPGFLPLEIPNYIHNPKSVSDLLLWTRRTKQKRGRRCPCWCNLQKVGAATAGKNPEKSREVGTSPSALCGQEGRSPLGKGWNGEEEPFYECVLAAIPAGMSKAPRCMRSIPIKRCWCWVLWAVIYLEAFRQHAYQWKLIKITLIPNKKIKLNCFRDTIIELYAHLQFEWK